MPSNPDTQDSIDAFGTPRNWRYVCQDNLELCPQDKPLELEFDEWKFNEDKGSYTPSAEMKFMYGEDIGRHETELISTIQNMKVSYCVSFSLCSNIILTSFTIEGNTE